MLRVNVYIKDLKHLYYTHTKFHQLVLNTIYVYTIQWICLIHPKSEKKMSYGYVWGCFLAGNSDCLAFLS